MSVSLPTGHPAEALALASADVRPGDHILGVDFTEEIAQAQAAGQAAADARSAFRPVPDVGASLPLP